MTSLTRTREMARRYARLGVLLAVLAWAACGPTGAPTGLDADAGASEEEASLTRIAGLGGSATVAADVNESLQVVGTAKTEGGASHAFLWHQGTARDLGTLGGAWSTASDVNEWGQVTGTSVTERGHARAYFWADGTMYEIGTLGGGESHGVAINDRGQVAGYSTTSNGEVHAFLWAHGRMHDLGTLGGSGSFTVATNDRGEVVGRAITEDGAAQAFRWSEGRITRLSPGPTRSSTAVDISANGHVLINTRRSGRGRAHVWSDGSMTALHAPGRATAVASAINASGQAVGQVSGRSVGTRAVLWKRGRALPLHGSDYARASTATDINDAGQVTGAFRKSESAGLRAFFWSGGEIRTLGSGHFGRLPESTTGVAVTESGVVLGLANDSADEVDAFLWRPLVTPRAGRPQERPWFEWSDTRRWTLSAWTEPETAGERREPEPAGGTIHGSTLERALNGVVPAPEADDRAWWPRSLAVYSTSER